MSLKRTLEPEVMESMEEAIAYDAMGHDTVNRVFVDDLAAAIRAAGLEEIPDVPLEMLDLGTGTAQIPIQWCKLHPDGRIMASDLSVNMLDVARTNVEIAGFIQRIQLDQVDAKQLHYDDGQFLVVISNSIIHHLPKPEIAVAESIRVTRAGGLLFFRDLLRPSSAEEVDALVQQYAGEETEHARQMFRDSLHAALDLAEIKAMIESHGFDPDTVQATSDRHWTWSAVKSTETT